MNYITETPEERANRLEKENDQLTQQVNHLEILYSATLQENGRMHAEMEELATRMHRLQLEALGCGTAKDELDTARATISRLNAAVCGHADSCADFEPHTLRAQVYLADD